MRLVKIDWVQPFAINWFLLAVSGEVFNEFNGQLFRRNDPRQSNETNVRLSNVPPEFKLNSNQPSLKRLRKPDEVQINVVFSDRYREFYLPKHETTHTILYLICTLGFVPLDARRFLVNISTYLQTEKFAHPVRQKFLTAPY